MTPTRITVETTVRAGIEKVWRCWTEPDHITQWNFASEEWHCPRASNDLRSGGTFNYHMASKDGKMGFDFEGVYDEVIQHLKIAYSLEDGRHVNIDFIANGSSCLIRETFDPESQNSIELQRSGWQAILANFKSHAESV